jgi:hypothetical protein
MWRFDGQINAGQTKKITYTRVQTQGFIVDSSFSAKQAGSVSFGERDLSRFQARLQVELEQKVGTRRETSESNSVIYEETLTLPAEPVNPNEPAVKSRGFYSGPEYVKLRIGIDAEHIQIGETISHHIEAMLHTGHFVGKQVDTLTNGTKMDRQTNRWP